MDYKHLFKEARSLLNVTPMMKRERMFVIVSCAEPRRRPELCVAITRYQLTGDLTPLGFDLYYLFNRAIRLLEVVE